jgi:hypothetical protein
MLCVAFVYAQLPDRFGLKKVDEEFLPRLALPFSKAEYILYTAVRTLAYYAGCAAFAGVVLSIGYLLGLRTAAALALIPFAVVFFASLHAVTLVGDCFSGFKFGRVVMLPFMIVALLTGEPFGSALARADPTGMLSATQRAFGLFVSGLARNPGPAMLIALAASVASVLFAALYARKIRF